MVPLLRCALAVGLIAYLSPVREPWGGLASGASAGLDRGALARAAGAAAGDRDALGRLAAGLATGDHEALRRTTAGLAAGDRERLARLLAVPSAEAGRIAEAWAGLSPETREALARRIAREMP